ncbi:cadherin-like domain-containing protein [Opitutales bacterium]|nr:cadherin-like domain-containing protein [Opitutales bacterium]
MNASVTKLSFLFFFFWGYVILKGQTYTFTNAGAEGREGPTQEQINTDYLGTNLEGKVTINTQGIQEWVVPADGNYSIEAYGAQGGGDYGGLGAKIRGSFFLSKDSLIKILVGQKGLLDGNMTTGGGGTYILKTPFNDQDSILIIAGGGGGAKDLENNQSITSGSEFEYGKNGVGSSNSYNGGSNGQGGLGGGNGGGGGGGGFFTDGTGGSSRGGKSFISGGLGGPAIGASFNLEGGFGGGGGGAFNGNASKGWAGGGGGGGYSGGGAAIAYYGYDDPTKAYGGGGGSFNSGTDKNNTSGVNEGHGKVIITFLDPANEAPVISQGVGPLSKVSSEDTQISWSASELNATDSETNAAQLSWSLLSSPSNGTAVVDGNGSYPQVFTYQPNANYYGSDSFSVQVSDGDANDSITINLTINPIDDPAVLSGDTTATTNEDSSISGDLNATDIDGLTDGSYFSISSSPASGALSLNEESGRWTYYPNSNTYGIDSFSVTITDDQNFTSTQVITITVTPVDDPASIYGDINASISEDSTASGDLNATDIDGLTDGSYFTISSNASYGTASIDTMEGNWTYIPSANFFGTDSFTVTISDDQGNTATQAISVTINSVNDTTTITGDTNATIKEDSNASGDLNATDIDGLTDGSYFTISATPSTGTALIDPLTGTWSFSPATDSYGTDSFTVTVTDDLNFTATQVISVIINAVDDPTVITGDISGPLFLDHPVSGDLNATDIDGLTDGSYFSIQTAPSNGTATVEPTSGNWEYTPPIGFLGDTSFIIQITDDQGFTSNQSITIIPQYNVPVAQTGTPTLSSGGKPTFSGSIQYHGGLPILEVGFYTSSSSQFSSSEKLPATLENNASTFAAYLNQTELISTIFVRAFARNQNGETLGEIKRLDPLPVLLQWSSHAITLESGWLQSDWFGTFSHYPKNWIFHSRLGWLYIPDTSSDDLWVWAPDHGWLWTQQGVFPHFYKNSTGNWIYLLENEIGGKNIYDYQSGLFK